MAVFINRICNPGEITATPTGRGSSKVARWAGEPHIAESSNGKKDIAFTIQLVDKKKGPGHLPVRMLIGKLLTCPAS
jgi:hypothetical protein